MKKRLVSLFVVITMVLSVTLISTDDAAASSTTYWLKVNRTANVVNVYKKSGENWKPYRAMLCSCGKSSGKTPKGISPLKRNGDGSLCSTGYPVSM